MSRSHLWILALALVIGLMALWGRRSEPEALKRGAAAASGKGGAAAPSGWVPLELTLREGITTADLERLSERGAELQIPAGGGRGVYRVPREHVAAVEADPAVRQVRRPRDHDKIAFTLRTALADAGGGPVDLHVRYVPAPAGAEVGGWLRARGDAAAVAALAADPRVHQIWPAPRPPHVHNVTAAARSRVPDLQPGGATGYNLTGSGVVLALWDGGPVRSTHQEFDTRVTVLEGTGTNYHATHVAGTMIASGVTASAKGMSPAATARSWDFNGSAITEWNTDKANYDAGNNSWGFITGWEGTTWYGGNGNAEDADFGKYTSSASQADSVTENDDVIQVKSAGNDRNDAATAGSHSHYGAGSGFTDPHNADGFDNGGFDTLADFSAAKNIIVVGALNDDDTMSAFSDWGPADDGRLKPDLCANGVGLNSSYDTSDTAYSSLSGTSMSGPTVTGSIGLLIQKFRGSGYGAAYKPPLSLVKALLIQTADDLGNAGPDYKFGWGLMDARAAAELIHADAGAFARLKHETLTNGGSFSWQFTLAVPQDVRVTLAWSDRSAAANTGGLDDSTPALVHNLNLRIDGASTYRPYVLNRLSPDAAATTGINAVDNVEQVFISAAPAGTYTVTVDHSGSLVASQKFSLAADLALSSGGGSSTAPTALTVTSLSSPTPAFSARHNDPQADAANKRRIQVGPTLASVTGETGLLWNEAAAGVAVANVLAGTQSPGYAYGGSTLSWNTTYYWRLKFWDVGAAEGDWSAVSTFTMGTPSVTLPNPAGWQMVTAPSGTAVAASALGGGTFYHWNEATRSYESVATLEPGTGYFWSGSGTMSLGSGTAVGGARLIGGLTSTDLATPAGMESTEDEYAGWHMIGNVYNGSIDWDAIYDGSFTTNLEATYYKWDGTQYISYNAVTNSGTAGATIGKFQAFWVHTVPLGATGSVTLQAPGSFGEPAVPVPFSSDWWLLQIAAEAAGGLRDDSTWVGVHSLGDTGWDVRDGSDPGTLAAPYINVYLDRPDLQGYGGRLQQDIRAPADSIEWILTVEADVVPLAVTLTWPNLDQIPAEWGLSLDGLDLRAAAGFTYTQTQPTQTLTVRATRTSAPAETVPVAASEEASASPAPTATVAEAASSSPSGGGGSSGGCSASGTAAPSPAWMAALLAALLLAARRR